MSGYKFNSLIALLNPTINTKVKPTAARSLRDELSSFLEGFIWAAHSGKGSSTL